MKNVGRLLQEGAADYTGVSMVRMRQFCSDAGLLALSLKERAAFCEKIDLPVTWLNKIAAQEYVFIGLNVADRICLACGKDVSQEFVVIPAGYKNAARRMAEDEFWAEAITPVQAQLDKRIQQLKDLRNDELGIPYCIGCHTLSGDFVPIGGHLVCLSCILRKVS